MSSHIQTDLLPCPHCGSSTEPGFADSVEFYNNEDDDSDYGWFVVCNASSNHAGCGAATGFYKTKTKATKAWNKRAPSAGPADTERLLIATNAYNAAIYEAAKCADDYAMNCMDNNEWKAGFDAGNDIARYIRALKNAAPQPQVGARKEGEPRLPAVAASEAGKEHDAWDAERIDNMILLLTADHNSGPNYVRGFELAREYMADRNEAEAFKRSHATAERQG